MISKDRKKKSPAMRRKREMPFVRLTRREREVYLGWREDF